jgi:hypothetical protein
LQPERVSIDDRQDLDVAFCVDGDDGALAEVRDQPDAIATAAGRENSRWGGGTQHGAPQFAVLVQRQHDDLVVLAEGCHVGDRRVRLAHAGGDWPAVGEPLGPHRPGAGRDDDGGTAGVHRADRDDVVVVVAQQPSLVQGVPMRPEHSPNEVERLFQRNYEVDRAAGDQFRKISPGIVAEARAVRHFLARAVRYLAGEANVRQFLDVGAGLPTVDNTHEVAQRVNPACS